MVIKAFEDMDYYCVDNIPPKVIPMLKVVELSKSGCRLYYSPVPHNVIFADIGAGTGLFAEKLATRSYAVYALEPNAGLPLHFTAY